MTNALPHRSFGLGTSPRHPEVRECDDARAWSDVLEQLPTYDLRQGFEWGEVLQLEGWTPSRWAVFDGKVPIAALSALVKPIPGLGHSVIYAPHGPVMRFTDDVAWQGVREAIRQLAARTQPILLRTSPVAAAGDREVEKAFERWGFRHIPDDWTVWNSPRIVMTLDLRPTEDELRRRLRRRHREYIASAPRRGVFVRGATSIDELQRFYRDLTARGRAKEFPVRRFEYFANLWRAYLVGGQGILLLAEQAGRLLGGLLGARIGRKACMLYSEVLREEDGVRLHQGPVLYWEFIRWAKAVGCDEIDWGGCATHFPPRPSDPGFGLYRFKVGFGATLEYRQGYYDLIFRPGLYRLLRVVEQHILPLAWGLRAKLNG